MSSLRDLESTPLIYHQPPLYGSTLMIAQADTEPGPASRGSIEKPLLPPTDGGWKAWSCLAASTGLETFVWGFATSYGVFLDYYTQTMTDTSFLAIVGTVLNGSMYLLLPLFTLFLTSHPTLRCPTMWIGLCLLVTGLVGAAFCTSVGGLVVTQGVLYGIGGTMLYCPCTSYMFGWWTRRRGLASGIMFSGTGAGGLIMPLVSSFLLQRFGQRTALLIIAAAYACILTPLIPFIRPRVPLSRSKELTNATQIDWGFIKHRAFWLLWLGVLLQGFAAFMPGTYLPAYATALHLPHKIGTLSIALLNLSRIPGQVVIGALSDRLGPRRLILAMAGVSALTVLAGWGAATGSGGVIGFALGFGCVAGSYTALFPRFISVIANDDPHLPQILYALFSFARGLGSILSGPISTALLQTSIRAGKGGYGVDGYGPLILWTGGAVALSALGAGYKGLKRD